MNRKLAIFGTCLPVIVVADLVTKSWALATLGGAPRPDFLGGRVPLNLVFNRGMAFGISIGDDPRWFFIPLTVAALGLMVLLAVQAEARDHPRIVALALVVSGAVGNLFDRIRWDRGVVDFIGPIDLGFMHWPVFNVADMAISTGAVLLAISFWTEDRRIKKRAAASAAEGEKAPPDAAPGDGSEVDRASPAQS